MTGIESGSDGSGIGPATAPVDAAPLRASPWEVRGSGGKAARQVGGRPILWKWWLLAGALSLALWAGIIALVT
jgi:hypothetical protein